MRPGWNPGRRNRHVGTGAHGHGADNRLVIPETRQHGEYAAYFEQLASPVAIERRVHERHLTLLVEPPRAGWFHPCSVDDVCHLLAHLHPEDVAAVDMVVMRQPTRKQRVLSQVWGRAVFWYVSAGKQGSAIVLEAQTDAPLSWPISLSPERIRELDRLRADGHAVRRAKRHVEIAPTAGTLRNTMLYRTLPHEVGHHVDRARHSFETWDSVTAAEREDFAHRYAAEAGERLRALGVLPFGPRLDADALSASGLRAEWFVPTLAPEEGTDA